MRPCLGTYLATLPSTTKRPSALMAWYSSREYLVKPHFLETTTFWRPGNFILRLRTTERDPHTQLYGEPRGRRGRRHQWNGQRWWGHQCWHERRDHRAYRRSVSYRSEDDRHRHRKASCWYGERAKGEYGFSCGSWCYRRTWSSTCCRQYGRLPKLQRKATNRPPETTPYLLLLIGKHVSDEGEGINGGALATNIVDTNLGI